MTTLETPLPVVPAQAVRTGRAAAPLLIAPVRVRLPGRTLLLVAGMPGAGKSTLLGGLRRGPGLTVLDSETYRAALDRGSPRLTYRRYRPVVHLLHRLAVVRAACSGTPTVVVHLPATAASTRTAVALLAALTGRDAHLLWLHVDPDDARRGQHDRGRVVPSRSFARHARRAAGTDGTLLRRRPAGFRGTTVLDRERSGAGLVLDTRTP